MTINEKNISVNPVLLTDELIEEVINYIKKDFNDLEPSIKYKVEVLKRNENIKYLKFSIYNKDFVLSPWFSTYLVNLQLNYLWPKQIYDIMFLYEEENT